MNYNVAYLFWLQLAAVCRRDCNLHLSVHSSKGWVLLVLLQGLCSLNRIMSQSA